MTISTLFQKLHDNIRVSDAEYLAYATHRKTVEGALANSFTGTTCELIGSHARESAIRGTSDQDYLARLPTREVRSLRGGELLSSNTVLRNVRTCLEQRFATTAIGKDGQAIVINFGAGTRDVDVVPAAFAAMTHVPILGANRPMFRIPDGSGGWILTAPAAHNEYLSLADVRSGGKLKYVSQLLRHWRSSRSTQIPIMTFHAELALAASGTCNQFASYSSILASAFAFLAQRRGQDLNDPLGISGNIPIAATASKRDRVVTHLLHAALHSARAVQFERSGDIQAAVGQWSIVFNDDFPRR